MGLCLSYINNGASELNLITVLCSMSKSAKVFDELLFIWVLSDELLCLLPFNDVLISEAFTIFKENRKKSS